jgi:hypothetical protein
MSWTGYVVDNSPLGFFQVLVTTPAGLRQDVTFFRGIPVQVSGLGTSDPFGDSTASIEFPQITMFDKLGYGDLDWLVPYSSVDIRWVSPSDDPNNPWNYEALNSWSWEGFIVSLDQQLDDNSSTLSVQCKGALFQLDNYMATPTFPSQPIPYELLIKDAFDPVKHPGLRTQPLLIEFPSDWNVKVPPPDKNPAHWYLVPWGVTTGQLWTGLTTRTTGAWTPALTGFVQELLTVMYTENNGQWTINKRAGRIPVLRVRYPKQFGDPDVLAISAGQPGVTVQLSKDFTQSATVIFGAGKDANGVSFSNEEVSTDGSETRYLPYAWAPQAYPATAQNPSYLSYYPRKEAYIQFTQGMTEEMSRTVAVQQLRRFGDPGYTGQVTLRTDPTQNGQTYPRYLIQAGMTLNVRGLFGNPEGILLHITEANIDVNEGVASLTVDSKYRDQLTVGEVQARTRDTLVPQRALQVGQVSPLVQDVIKPWSYAKGSGCIPSGGAYDSTDFFTKLIDPTSVFPWTEWTTKYPPSNPSYRKFYIPIGPKSTNPANSAPNWSAISRIGQNGFAIPIKGAQAGTIRLTQIAAYDKDGHVMPIRFHASLYGPPGIGITGMPSITTGYHTTYSLPYNDGQPYPFFPGAFEKYNDSGEQNSNIFQELPLNNTLLIGWGNYYQPAGYSPGLFTAGAPKTGLLIDETPWSFDTTGGTTNIDPQSIARTNAIADAGFLYIMIYADDQGTQPVYFLGRIFRQEPGSS